MANDDYPIVCQPTLKVGGHLHLVEHVPTLNGSVVERVGDDRTLRVARVPIRAFIDRYSRPGLRIQIQDQIASPFCSTSCINRS